MTNKMRSTAIMSGKTTTGAGDWYQFPSKKSIHIEGITTGTVTIEGSNDKANAIVLSTDTSDNLRGLDSPVVWIRANVTVATSVSVTVVVGWEVD